MIELLRQKQQTSIQQGHRVQFYHHSFSLKILSESHWQNKQIWLFCIIISSSTTFPWVFPHSEHNSYSYNWLNCVSLHLRWSFCTHQYSRLITEWPLRLVSHPIAILSCVQRTNWMRLISDKVRMTFFSAIDRLGRPPCSRILICILYFHPDWIWLNIFIWSQYFATI